MDSGEIGEAIARLRAALPELSARCRAMRTMLDRPAAEPGASPEQAVPRSRELLSCLDAQDDALAEAGRAAEALSAALHVNKTPQAQRFQFQKWRPSAS
jgi:hypothetical protein